MVLWPSMAISLAVIGFNMLGEALRDVLDPYLRGGGGRATERPPRPGSPAGRR